MEIKTLELNELILNIVNQCWARGATPLPKVPAHCPTLSFTKTPLVNDQVP